MRILVLAALAGLLAGCTTATPYWTRPGASRPALVAESEGCYRSSLDFEAPSAFPRTPDGPRLLPRSTPPPRVWDRAPGNAAFERFDEQLRYEKCMTARGWQPARGAGPSL
jgi:hypothetical protein